jgi:hypothetical protein
VPDNLCRSQSPRGRPEHVQKTDLKCGYTKKHKLYLERNIEYKNEIVNRNAVATQSAKEMIAAGLSAE